MLFRSFLVLERRGIGVRTIMRIDNSVEWYLLGKDRLSLDYHSPMMDDTPFTGYAEFWRQVLFDEFLRENPKAKSVPEDLRFILNKKPISFEKIYSWILFIKAYPEAEYLKLFARGMENKCRFFGNLSEHSRWNNAPEVMFQARCDKIMGILKERKRNLDADFRRFFGELKGLVGMEFHPAAQTNFFSIEESIESNLRTERSELERVREFLKNSPSQEVLRGLISFRGHQRLYDVSKLEHMSREVRLASLNKAISELQSIRNKASDESEKQALDNAIQNLRVLERCVNVSDKINLKATLHLNRFFRPSWIGEKDGVCEFGTMSAE